MQTSRQNCHGAGEKRWDLFKFRVECLTSAHFSFLFPSVLSLSFISLHFSYSLANSLLARNSARLSSPWMHSKSCLQLGKLRKWPRSKGLDS